MSDIFARLMAEGDRQKQQLQPRTPLSSNQTQEVFVQPSSPNIVEARRNNETTERRSDVATQRQSDGNTARPSDGSTVRRKTERAAFDLYEDQVNAIRRLRAERELQDGKKISLSDIAREAFDLFLQSNKNK